MRSSRIRCLGGVMILSVLALTGCSDTLSFTEGEITRASDTWANQTALRTPDTESWEERLGLMCDREPTAESMVPLAEQFVSADAAGSMDPAGALPPVETAAEALRIIALDVCP